MATIPVEKQSLLVKLAQLGYYDEKIKAYIAAEDKKITDSIGTVPAGSTVMAEIGKVDAAVTAHKDAIDDVVTTLVGSDASKSVRTIANEELAAQLLSGKADADFQTLKQLADWLEDHPEEAAAMNSAISDLETAVGTKKTSTDAATGIYKDIDDINTVISSIQGDYNGLGALAAKDEIADADVAANAAIAQTKIAGLVDDLASKVDKVTGYGLSKNDYDDTEKAQVAANKSDIATLHRLVGPDSVGDQIEGKINALDATVTSAAVAAGKGLQVSVTEEDGLLKSVSVTGTYDNTYEPVGEVAKVVGTIPANVVVDATTTIATATVVGYIDAKIQKVTAESGVGTLEYAANTDIDLLFA